MLLWSYKMTTDGYDPAKISDGTSQVQIEIKIAKKVRVSSGIFYTFTVHWKT